MKKSNFNNEYKFGNPNNIAILYCISFFSTKKKDFIFYVFQLKYGFLYLVCILKLCGQTLHLYVGNILFMWTNLNFYMQEFVLICIPLRIWTSLNFHVDKYHGQI